VVRLENLANPLHAAIEVGLQLFSELLARGLVGRIAFVAKRETRVVDPPEIFGPVGVDESVEEVDDAPGGGCVFAAARRERPRDQREEGAIDQRVAVNEE
jgi:hypothetical protein